MLCYQFFEPSVNSNFASWASLSVPSVWNSLKPSLRSIDSAASFKSQLNTTLFLSALVALRSTIRSHPALLIRFILSTRALYKLYCIVFIAWRTSLSEWDLKEQVTRFRNAFRECSDIFSRSFERFSRPCRRASYWHGWDNCMLKLYNSLCNRRVVEADYSYCL